jgi:HD-GYP domain-containing protein (c-di-GMP phosphodiesterase class II)
MIKEVFSMRAALSDHEDSYHGFKGEAIADVGLGLADEHASSVIIADSDIPGLSLLDFGSILGISLLSSAVDSSKHEYITEIVDSKQVDLPADAILSENCYFARHARHVAEYSLAVAREMRLPVQQKKAIYVAGFLHDIGKLQVAPSIVYKKGPLTADEYEQMKMHPILAMKMLSKVTFPWPVKPLILYHHERCDGSGYPEGLTEADIPLGARILGVADFVDAYTSERLYERAHSLDELVELLIAYSGTIYDEVVCVALMEMIEDGTLWIHQEYELGEEKVSEASEAFTLFDGETVLGH